MARPKAVAGKHPQKRRDSRRKTHKRPKAKKENNMMRRNQTPKKSGTHGFPPHKVETGRVPTKGRQCSGQHRPRCRGSQLNSHVGESESLTYPPRLCLLGGSRQEPQNAGNTPALSQHRPPGPPDLSPPCPRYPMIPPPVRRRPNPSGLPNPQITIPVHGQHARSMRDA